MPSINQPFVMTPTAVLFDNQLPPMARLLWAALEHYSGGNPTCWPGYPALARTVGCSARWVPELLKKLVEAGLLVIQSRIGRTNIYRLVGRVARQRATQEGRLGAPRKPDANNQKQPPKTNKKGGSNPPAGKINFAKYKSDGKFGFLGLAD